MFKASASRAEGPGFESRLRRDFSGSSHTSDLNIGTPVATLPGAWRYRVSGGTGRPGVSILWRWKVGSAASISVWQHVKLSVQIRPWDTLACCWDVKQPTNKHSIPGNIVLNNCQVNLLSMILSLFLQVIHINTCSLQIFASSLMHLINVSSSSPSKFHSYISGVHHFGWDFCVCNCCLIQPLR